jgi:tripartite-type tricarboxylate transporter receptor subunit TctC
MLKRGKKNSIVFGSLVFVLVLMLATTAFAARKYPSRPIVMVVPFSPGGATDQIGRKLSPNMQKYLKTPIAVQNMPGGATAIGNQYVYDAPRDGYTVLVQPTDITSIAVMGQSKLTWRNWDFLGIAAAVPAVFLVHPDSPLKNIKDLERALHEKQLTCAVAADGCAWTRAIGLYNNLIKGKMPKLVPMGGGYPAAVSALKKEVDIASCGLPEAYDLIAGKKLRVIGYWGTASIKVPGYGKIDSVVETYPTFKKYLPFGGWVGMAVPKGLPDNVLNKLQKAYNYAAAQPEFEDFLQKSFFVKVGLSGKKATDFAALSTSVNAWLLYDLGFAQKNPRDLDIPRP